MPSRKRRGENASAMLVQELKGGLKDIANLINTNDKASGMKSCRRLCEGMKEFEMGISTWSSLSSKRIS